MSHETLWAPWRLSYVKSPDKPQGNHCFLCEFPKLTPDNDRNHLVLVRGTWSCVILNRYPYNNGHLLVAPYAHKADLLDLTEAESAECQQLIRNMLGRIKTAMSPDGFNVGINLGRVAGAGLPGHLHWHIVPRWNGDTNFMPILADVSLIPQSLDALYDMLAQTADPEPPASR